MLTKLTVRNFKQFGRAEIDLAQDVGQPVVLIGPNNSGKTTALQALTLWSLGLRQWTAKRGEKAAPEKRPGVTINRKDLTQVPVPAADLLWKDLETRRGRRVNDKPATENVRIDISVDGFTNGKVWTCGLEFDYANEESFLCRPLREPGQDAAKVADCRFLPVPPEAGEVKVAFLPPMSGLAAEEPRWEPGRINVLIGQGQTAQVIRNLCSLVQERDPKAWDDLTRTIDTMFGARLQPPRFIAERGEIAMDYEERGARLDLSSAGRGLQQTLLLLAHMYANPRTVLLLDEPDAHLEVLRQKQIFNTISDVAEQQQSQIIAASHSEVVLNEAASRGTVVAFVGSPHRANAKPAQVIKSLTTIGFEDYYLAELNGWVLYLEAPSDLSMLQALASRLSHDASARMLERPFVKYVANNIPTIARDHFHGLAEAKPDLVGLAIFDRLDKRLRAEGPLQERMWQRREIENYVCLPETLLSFAAGEKADDLFGSMESDKRVAAMREAIGEVERSLATLGKPSPWGPDLKVSDEFLEPVFRLFATNLGVHLELRKRDYHRLVVFANPASLDREIREMLDSIVSTASLARPVT